LVPLHVQGEGEVSLSDLALLCPTCHRTVHKHRPFLTPDELRQRRSRP
ncbi:MAG: HNH endonuclease, partial [Actinobacteria bacterium]|nr:HNH endonuclease [Actinomycetota bacterium]